MKPQPEVYTAIADNQTTYKLYCEFVKEALEDGKEKERDE